MFIREVNSAYHTYWLVSLEVIRKSYSPPRSRKDKIVRHRFNFRAFYGILTYFWVVCTMIIFLLSVGGSGINKLVISPLIRLYFKSRCLRKIKNEGLYFSLTVS